MIRVTISVYFPADTHREYLMGRQRATPNVLIIASRSFFFGILIAAMGRATAKK